MSDNSRDNNLIAGGALMVFGIILATAGFIVPVANYNYPQYLTDIGTIVTFFGILMVITAAIRSEIKYDKEKNAHWDAKTEVQKWLDNKNE